MFRWLIVAAALLCGVPAAHAQQTQKPFKPDGPTVNLAAGVATARVVVQGSNNSRNVRVYNSGTVAAFIECGNTAVVATITASMPIAPGATHVIGCPASNIAAITASGTATVYFTPGQGM